MLTIPFQFFYSLSFFFFDQYYHTLATQFNVYGYTFFSINPIIKSFILYVCKHTENNRNH